jgi:uncharacterized protein
VFNKTPSDPNRFEGPPEGSNPLPFSWTTGVSTAQPVAVPREGFLTMSFVWMFLALLVSAITASMTLANQTALQAVANNFLLLLFAELGLVFVLSAAINRINATFAVGLLFVYAALTGATFSILFVVYTLPSVTTAFLGASGIFGAAALYGALTGRDLTHLGGFLFVGLIGIIVASVANFWVGGGTLGFVIGVVGVLIFTGLTAYDVQRIRNGQMRWITSREQASVIGALALYLDFVNLFLMLLRVFGQRR